MQTLPKHVAMEMALNLSLPILLIFILHRKIIKLFAIQKFSG